MAYTISRTYKPSDWSIWTYNPVANKFTLDFSQLDDATKPLSATDGTITKMDARISDLSINDGSSVDGSIFAQSTPSTATVSIEVKDFTKSQANNFLAGTDIWITVKNAESVDNIWNNLGKNTPLFMGRIESFSVDVQPGTNISAISISANSYSFDDYNTLLAINTSAGLDKNVAISTAASNIGIWSSLLYADGMYPRGNVVKTYGEWIAEMFATEIRIPADYTDQRVITGPSATRSITYSPGIRDVIATTASSSFDDSEIVAATIDWSNSVAPTSVTLTNEGNSSLIWQIGSQYPGGSTYSANVDVVDTTIMNAKAVRMINYKKNFVPTKITVLLANSNQSLNWVDTTDKTFSTWLYPEKLRRIGEKVTVTLADQGFTAETVFITGRSIAVNYDSWTVTYDLWKGFTD